MHVFFCIFTKIHQNRVTLTKNNRLIYHFIVLIDTIMNYPIII